MAQHLAAVIVCVTCGGLLAPAGEARAQCDYSLTIYPPSDVDGGASLRGLTVFDDGSGPAVIAAGSEILERPGSSSEYYNIARWRPSTGWEPLGEPGEMSSVHDLDVFDGQLYATNHSGPHRWTGSGWQALGTGLVGGTLVIVEGLGKAKAEFLAITEAWSQSPRLFRLESGVWKQAAQFTGSIATVEAFQGGLIVSGFFSEIDQTPISRFAAWDGVEWVALGNNLTAEASVATDLIEMEIAGEPALAACGTFVIESAGLTTDMAYWDGDEWNALPDAPHGSYGIQDGIGPLGVWDNGDGNGPALCVAVSTESPYSGDSHATLNRLDPATNRWQGIGSTFWLPSSWISALTPFVEDAGQAATLYVGGKFDEFDNVYTLHLARVLPEPDGAIEPLPADPRSLRGDIAALAGFEHNGQWALYTGGRFRDVPGGTLFTHVARFDGDYWTAVPGAMVNQLQVLKTLDDGGGPALFAGGGGVAKWDGVSWTELGSIGSVRDLCVHNDGTGPAIYAALGNNTVAKWNPGSQTWTTISTAFTGGSFGPSVNALASFDDGSGAALYVGGRFTAVGSVQASNIARWRGASVGWQAVGPGRPGAVDLLHVHDDGGGARLIAAAEWSQQGGVAQWDGAAWSPVGDAPAIDFGPGGGAMTTFDDGGGPSLAVTSLQRAARWNGSTWAYLPDFGADALAAHDGVLYLGTPFAIWAPGGDQLAIESVSGGGAVEPWTSTTLRAHIIHGGAVNYQWRHDGAPLDNIGGYFRSHTSGLWISGIDGSHEGVYDVVVTNDCTSVTSEPVMLDVIGSCVGDITADNAVQGDDIVALVMAWGACPPSCPSDLTHDDAVDIDDLLLLISRWGPCS